MGCGRRGIRDRQGGGGNGIGHSSIGSQGGCRYGQAHGGRVGRGVSRGGYGGKLNSHGQGGRINKDWWQQKDSVYSPSGIY